MTKRLFWLAVGAIAATLGLRFLKKKSEENPEQFSTDALVEKLVGIFPVVKVYVQGFWRAYSGDETLDEIKLEKIFDAQTEFAPEFDTAIKPSDVSLN